MIIKGFLARASQQLASISESPKLDAEILLANALGKSRAYLFAHPDEIVDETHAEFFESALQRRCQREPMAYITGRQEFWSLALNVNNATLIPRPETELLVASVLELIAAKNGVNVADLGTGSGAVALAIAHERPGWHVFATDISEDALTVARKNAHELGLNNISFYSGSWCAALPNVEFDVVVSNPPYIAEAEWSEYASGLVYEPRNALVSGVDGLEALREVIYSAPAKLKSGAHVLVEHGFLQASAVRELFAQAGYTEIVSLRDYSQHERVTKARCIK